MGAVELSEEKDGYRPDRDRNDPTYVQPTSGSNFNIRGMFAGTLGYLHVISDRIQGQLDPWIRSTAAR
jgi:hypothetical protein